MNRDPLSTGPQVPVDYANHIIQGGALSWFIAGLVHAWVVVHLGHPVNVWKPALVVTLLIGFAKKVYDYFAEGESVRTCVQKTLVTALVPAWVLLNQYIGF